MNLVSHWTVVPIVLKPDALEGPATSVIGPLAADFASYLCDALDPSSPPAHEPYVAESEGAAELARNHIIAESRAFPWYVLNLRQLESCRCRLRTLAAAWVKLENLPVVNVITEACMALGFDVVLSDDRIVTTEVYQALYGDTDEPSMHPKMRAYMMQRRVRLILLCGPQENSALQIMKTYLRRIMRYPTAASYRIENWLHVTNPDAANYPQLLSMFGTLSTGRVNSQSFS